MAYSELIKNFDRIRDYMRQFYIYGFKSRTEYDKKSARSYDNERRRIESWLGDFMRFRQAAPVQILSSVLPPRPALRGHTRKLCEYLKMGSSFQRQ